jgi:hypothetical protein
MNIMFCGTSNSRDRAATVAGLKSPLKLGKALVQSHAVHQATYPHIAGEHGAGEIGVCRGLPPTSKPLRLTRSSLTVAISGTGIKLRARRAIIGLKIVTASHMLRRVRRERLRDVASPHSWRSSQSR